MLFFCEQNLHRKVSDQEMTTKTVPQPLDCTSSATRPIKQSVSYPEPGAKLAASGWAATASRTLKLRNRYSWPRETSPNLRALNPTTPSELDSQNGIETLVSTSHQPNSKLWRCFLYPLQQSQKNGFVYLSPARNNATELHRS